MSDWGRRHCDIDERFGGGSDKSEILISTWRHTKLTTERLTFPRWNSIPQSHPAKHRKLPFIFIRTTEISLSYSSTSISCRLSGLIKNAEFLLSKRLAPSEGPTQYGRHLLSASHRRLIRAPVYCSYKILNKVICSKELKKMTSWGIGWNKRT